MGKKSVEGINIIVSKAMAKNPCSIHHLAITSVNLDTLQLGCLKCFKQNAINIADLVANPIQAVINSSQKKISMRGLLHDLETHYQVKTGFEALIEQIRKEVNLFCDEALKQYRNKWQNAFNEANQMIAQIRTAQSHYRKVFEELLETKFQKATVFQLKTCLNQFKNQCSQDPTDYLKTRMQFWLQSLKKMPIVDWKSLKSIYERLTDPQLLDKQNFIKHSYGQYKEEDQVEDEKKIITLIPEIKNKLKKKQYYAKFDRQGLFIYKEEGAIYQKIGQLKQNNDTYLDIGKNTLIGINYGSVSFYQYGFGKILKIKTYSIAGCLNLLVFPECLIIQAEGRINRIWLSDGFKQVICLSGSQISYTKNPYQFSYKNSKNQTILHPALHNQI